MIGENLIRFVQNADKKTQNKIIRSVGDALQMQTIIRGFIISRMENAPMNRDRETKNAKSDMSKKDLKKGLCFRCGKYPSINGSKYSMCVQCNAKNAAKKRERMRKKGALPWILRGNGLYCFHCCKPVCKGEKLCHECYEKICENLRVASEKGQTSPDNWHNKKFNFRKRIKEERKNESKN